MTRSRVPESVSGNPNGTGPQPPAPKTAPPCAEIAPPTRLGLHGTGTARAGPGKKNVSVAPNAQGAGGQIGIPPGPVDEPSQMNVAGPVIPERVKLTVAPSVGLPAEVKVRPPQPVGLRVTEPAPPVVVTRRVKFPAAPANPPTRTK